jgi:phosphatidylglycerophosphate synthase
MMKTNTVNQWTNKHLTEYKRSLKNSQAEEFLDVVLYRPLAYIIIRALDILRLKPNHYTFMALIAGLIGAYDLTKGDAAHFIRGSLLFGLFSILDCCDGMQARLKNNGSEWGRILDGVVDYTVNICSYIGLGIGLSKGIIPLPYSPWMLVILSGVSKLFHSATYDHYLYEFLCYHNHGYSYLGKEKEKTQQQLHRVQGQPGMLFTQYGLKIYLLFLHFQGLVSGNSSSSQQNQSKNLTLMKLWGVIAPTVHVTIMMIAFYYVQPMIYFFYSVIFANLWFVILLILQRRKDQNN